MVALKAGRSNKLETWFTVGRWVEFVFTEYLLGKL